MDYILLLIGFVCLVKGADFFVSGSSAIARHFNIPAFIIGLTIVAFGTSMPEAAVSVTAAIKGANGIAVGNVLGSNMFNLLVVLGASAIIKACPVSKSTLRFEFPLSIVAAAIVLLFCMGNSSNMLILSRMDGVVLLCVFVFFIAMTLHTVLMSNDANLPSQMPAPGSEENAHKEISLPKGVILSIIGIAGIIIGGDVTVDSATNIALHFGIDETLIGLTIVAMGTSLPELVTSVVAALKDETDIAVGNVIGSNIFNLLFVLGLSVTIHPISVTMFSVYDAIILIAVSLIAMIPMIRNRAFTRMWGIFFLIMYAAYLVYIIMRTM
ncbi:MAG: calcium/sodium antiporter [Bacillota bacterium]|nr:calcium/sodium antiporter [Bacillota bacterium]